MESIFKRVLRAFRSGRASMSDFDAWWTGYSIAIPGIAGSLLSFLYFGAGIWAVVGVAFSRFPFDIPKKSKIFVFACVGYALVLLASSLLNDGVRGLIPGLVAGSALYFVPFLISRYRFSDPQRSFEILCEYAPVGALLCICAAVYQQFITAGAIEGAAGNGSVFGYISAVLGCISLSNGQSYKPIRRVISFVGFLAGMSALLMSQTRSLYPVIILAPLFFLVLSGNITQKKFWASATIFSAALTCVFFMFQSRFVTEFFGTVDELQKLGGDTSISSFGVRVEMWKAAYWSFWDAPWFGHGQLQKMNGIYVRLPEIISYVRFSHAHNVWVDSALSGGLFGLVLVTLIFVSPLALMKGVLESHKNFRLNYNILILVSTSVLNSIFGTLFSHDILVSVFLIPLIVISSLTEDLELL